MKSDMQNLLEIEYFNAVIFILLLINSLPKNEN